MPEVRPAVGQGVAQALALGDDDVGPVGARPPEEAEADRVDADDRQGAPLMRRVDQRLDVLELAEDVRVLEHDGGRVVGDLVGEPIRIDSTALRPAR